MAIWAGRAPWILEADEPAVLAAKTQARKIDERVAAAEASAEAVLFDNGAILPLAEMSGGFSYDLEILFRMLDGLGLTPRGRAQLTIELEEGSDELAAVVNLDLELPTGADR